MEQVLGAASVQRVGILAFPVFELVCKDEDSEGEIRARMARGGWFRIFFGRGQRVELPDGTPWRIQAAGGGGRITPVVTCESGKLAEAAPHGKRSYGINGRDYAYNLYPTRREGPGKPTWILREHETELATCDSRSIEAGHPVPLAAVLLCFTLIKYGVPGEANLWVPRFRW